YEKARTRRASDSTDTESLCEKLLCHGVILHDLVTFFRVKAPTDTQQNRLCQHSGTASRGDLYFTFPVIPKNGVGHIILIIDFMTDGA
ncbi:hypothetical protein WDT82_28595, partial [Klebsiella pneumoniae]